MSPGKAELSRAGMPLRGPEQWRDVVGYAGYYQVSSEGRVKSLGRSVDGPWGVMTLGTKILRGRDCRGYKRIQLNRNTEKKYKYVHTLVLEAFIGPKPSAMHQCQHIDGCRANNAATNLKWALRA
jgi:hypothetical protein